VKTRSAGGRKWVGRKRWETCECEKEKRRENFGSSLQGEERNEGNHPVQIEVELRFAHRGGGSPKERRLPVRQQFPKTKKHGNEGGRATAGGNEEMKGQEA